MKDTRIAYGACCCWWDSVHKAGSTATHPRHSIGRNVVLTRGDGSTIGKVGQFALPCCPGCGSMLFEVPNEKTWFASVDAHESKGHPGYRAFIEWLRGKCFASMIDALAAYKRATGKTVGGEEATDGN